MRRQMLSAVSAVVLVTYMGPDTADAQTAKDLVGTWTVVSNINTQPDGSKNDAFGATPKGMMICDPSGHFVLITVRPDLPKFASGNRNTGTPDENKAVVQGTIGLFGSYTVADKVLLLKVEAGTWPPFDGTDQKRPLTSFTPDDVVWTVASPAGGSSEVHWKRLR